MIVGDTDVGSPGGPAPAPSSEAGSGAGGGSGAGACTVAEACDGAARAVATAGEAVIGEAPAGVEPGMLVSMDDLKPREVPRDRAAVVALADIVGRRVRVSVLDGRVFYGLLAVCLRACAATAPRWGRGR